MAAPVRRLTTEEVAELLGVGVTTLRDWRREGRGPRYWQEGAVIRYRETDVEAWEKSCLAETGT